MAGKHIKKPFCLNAYGEMTEKFFKAFLGMWNEMAKKADNYVYFSYGTGTFDMNTARMLIKENDFTILQYTASGTPLNVAPITRYNQLPHRTLEDYSPKAVQDLAEHYSKVDDYVGRSSEQRGKIQLHKEACTAWSHLDRDDHFEAKDITSLMKMLAVIILSMLEKDTRRIQVCIKSKLRYSDGTCSEAHITTLKTGEASYCFTTDEMKQFISFCDILSSKKEPKKTNAAVANFIKAYGEAAWDAFYGKPEEDPFKLYSYDEVSKCYYGAFQDFITNPINPEKLAEAVYF